MKGVFVGKNNLREIRDFEVPKPAAGEILIKSEPFLYYTPTSNASLTN